jgi:prevent-host-death family protein
MRSVSVKELQNDFNRYLDEVQAGTEMLIKRRNKAVAKIIPINNDEDPEAYLAQLAAEGKLRLPIASLTEEFLNEPLVPITARSLVPLISEDRDED